MSSMESYWTGLRNYASGNNTQEAAEANALSAVAEFMMMMKILMMMKMIRMETHPVTEKTLLRWLQGCQG